VVSALNGEIKRYAMLQGADDSSPNLWTHLLKLHRTGIPLLIRVHAARLDPVTSNFLEIRRHAAAELALSPGQMKCDCVLRSLHGNAVSVDGGSPRILACINRQFASDRGFRDQFGAPQPHQCSCLMWRLRFCD